MKVKVMAVPFDAASRDFDDRALQAFLQNKRVVRFSDHLLESPAGSYMCVTFSYEDSAAPSPSERADRPAAGAEGSGARNGAPAADGNNGDAGAKRAPTPPPSHLSPAQQAVFSKMRRWRFSRAQRLNVPPYEICTNLELEQMVVELPRTAADLVAAKWMDADRAARHAADNVAELGRAAGAARPAGAAAAS